MWTLTLEYYNAAGTWVEQVLPVFDSLKECEWWREYFFQTLITFNNVEWVSGWCELPKVLK